MSLSDNELGITYAVIVLILWGVAYSALPPVTSILRSETVMFLYFSTGSVISFCFIVIKGLISGANAAIFEDFKLIDWRILGYFLIYALFSLAASFLYYSGYKLVGKSYSGGFNAITTCYVVIVFVIGYFYWDQKSFNLWLAIPGILLTVVGTILLSLAPF